MTNSHRLAKICQTFRASSRLFYPVYYCIFIAIILSIWNKKNVIGVPRVRIFLFFILAVQICDLSNVIVQKHQHMNRIESFKSILDDTELNAILRTRRHIIIDPEFWSLFEPRSFAVAALKNRNVLYYSLSNRRFSGNPFSEAIDVLASIKKSGNIDPYLVATQCSVARDTYLKLKDTEHLKRGEWCYVYSNSRQ